MLSLYEILKASKTGVATDMWTALAGMNWGGADSGHEVKKLTGIPPLSFRADGTPLLDYLISGNTEQTGTPTPDNPITPEGTGKRTGNLFDKSTATLGKVWYQGGERNSTVGGYSGYIKVTPETNYYIVNVLPLSVWYSVCAYTATKQFIAYCNLSSLDATQGVITTPANCEYIIINFYANRIDEVMVNAGSTALPYEPYGIKIPILSAGQTTPIYLGEVQTTRRIKKLVLTGEETIYKYTYSGTNGFSVMNVLNANYNRVYGICTHYPVKSVAEKNALWIGVNDKTLYFVGIGNALGITESSDFKSYLAAQYAAGTPVTIWYVLATEEIGIVNEPLRKIGDYADTLSYEQAGVQIPTNRGNTVIDVETTLKPSQMYIKYQE